MLKFYIDIMFTFYINIRGKRQIYNYYAFFPKNFTGVSYFLNWVECIYYWFIFVLLEDIIYDTKLKKKKCVETIYIFKYTKGILFLSERRTHFL